MNSLVIFSISVVLLVPIPVFAETFEVRILEGSSTQGCETTDSCISPSAITIHKGDSINWIREEDVSHAIRGENYQGEMSFFTIDYSHTFNKIGTIDYFVTDMPWIKGTILVESVPISKPYEIRDDANGGNCDLIGDWNPTSKTCKVTSDIDGSLLILSNNLEIDGSGHILDGHYDSRINSPTNCISADAKLGITIKNFEIKNCAIGISFQDVSDSVIKDNTISENFAGAIHILASNNNIIENNQISNNPNGGIAVNGDNNLIENNVIENNSPLYLEHDLQGVGLSLNLENSKNNIFRSNVVDGHKTGISVDGVYLKNDIQKNKITNNKLGMGLATSENFILFGNLIENNEIGINSKMYAGKGGKNTIEENKIIGNEEGIHLESKLNIITKNTISNNSQYGIWMDSRDARTFDYDNKIYNNNFIDNSRQVFHGETNYFTVNNFGNYWSDFSTNCADLDSDKICDEPYPFSSGTVGVTDTSVWKEKDGWMKISSEDQVVGIEIGKKIPEWVKNTMRGYLDGLISEDEMISAIKFLINEKIIELEN